MVRVVFVDGEEETFESKYHGYVYDENNQLFVIRDKNDVDIMIQREFVRYIQVVEV